MIHLLPVCNLTLTDLTIKYITLIYFSVSLYHVLFDNNIIHSNRILLCIMCYCAVWPWPTSHVLLCSLTLTHFPCVNFILTVYYVYPYYDSILCRVMMFGILSTCDIFWLVCCIILPEHGTRHVQETKAQISLCIHATCSVLILESRC